MSNSDPIRWRQRLESFEAAMAQLQAACGLDRYSELERAGLVQMFEFSFELAWKTLRDLLYVEGIEVNSPRQTLREAFEFGVIDQVDLWLEAMQNRNRLSHTYNEHAAQEAERLIKDVYAPLLNDLLRTLRDRRDST